MKKTHILILIIIILIIFLVIWSIAFSYFSNRIDDSTRQAFVNETMLYLSTNGEFIHKYGLIISIESKDKLPVKNETSELTEYYMDFNCVTEKGCFGIRVYHTWLDTWTYSFEEIDIE